MYSGTSFIGSRSNSAGTTSPAIPFAASAATVRGWRPSTSANVRRCARYSSRMSACSTRPFDMAGGVGEPVAGIPSAISRICWRPVSSPTGAAPDRHSFSPLYWGGLWLAVNIAPGSARRPEAK